MISKEDQEFVLRFLVPCMTLWGILYLCGYHVTYFGDPIAAWMMLAVWVGNSLFWWKDKRQLFKRWILVLPFVLLTVTLLTITVLDLTGSCLFGIVMFALLTWPTKNLKGGFVVSLVIGAIVVSLMVIMVILMKTVQSGHIK